MYRSKLVSIFAIVACISILAVSQLYADTVKSSLRLVPYPKYLSTNSGYFKVTKGMEITVPESQAIAQAAAELSEDIALVYKIKCRIKTLPQMKASSFKMVLGKDKKTIQMVPGNIEGYSLIISGNGVVAESRGAEGLLNGIQAVRQMIIANGTKNGIPCVEIRDYPSLRYRGFQDDITRGRNSKLSTFERQVRVARYLRLNFFTYYLEHQFAFAKNPVIGPANGSLTPDDLKSLVSYARNYDVDIVGCQQSLGHFYHILKHPEYAHLKEGNDCLDPTNEGTYKLLDEMYSEQIPLLDAELFNIDCDETYELGSGPSKPLAQKIGVGGVYTMHIRRVHDLITNKYGKRMMMWGDIILQHPENLNDIPKDTIMLSWGYHAGESFDDAVTPFKNSGYDFIVCPGVSSWSRILPDFNTANINIRNYVKSGVKFGAMGMLNTSWGDDGENLMGYNWHGIAWGAECSWTGSKTDIADFNKRVGAVLFGEKGDHFGQAITLLTKTHAIPGFSGMNDGRFWQGDFGSMAAGRQSSINQANMLLKLVNPALNHLYAAKRDARINKDQLDYFIFGATRMKIMGDRIIAYMDAADAYNKAYRNQTNKSQAADQLKKAVSLLGNARAQHQSARDRYVELWNLEARPYTLDNIVKRYNGLIERYDKILDGLADAEAALNAGKEMPAGDDIGLGIVETSVRRSAPDSQAATAYKPEAPWHLSGYNKRTGITVSAGDYNRCDQPVELDISNIGIGKDAALVQADNALTVPCQIISEGKIRKLAFMASGDIPKGSERSYFLYYAPSKGAKQVSLPAMKVTNAAEGKWIESDKLRLLIGKEGGHIYRWEVKSMNNLDLTHPGETDWSGFADLGGGSRNAANTIQVLASGPVLTRIKLKDTIGVTRTISVWAGVEWVEVNLESGTSWFCNYDDYNLMGAGTSNSGYYILSTGDTGPLKPILGGNMSCTSIADAYWGAKYANDGAMIAMLTPETVTTMIVGPGDGMGAVSLNYGREASHFVIFGGKTPAEPKDTLDIMRNTLDYKQWPKTRIYKAQDRKSD